MSKKIKEKEKEIKDSIKNSKKEADDNNQKGECLTVMTGHNYNVVDISLPNNFFEQIMENEIELSEGFKYEKLASLVQLYLNGIQYYSSYEPEKVKGYQNRLEFLLTQKDTLKNLCNRKKNEEEIKSSKSSNQIRGRLKTKFKIESDGIKKDDITQKVKKIKNEHLNTKEDKKNVKVLINNEFETQSKKWKEKLAQKRSVMNTNRSFLRTSGRKFFNTPAPVIRNTLSIGTTRPDISKFEKSGKALLKFGDIDDDDSEGDNKSENGGEVDFLKMFKEKHNDENKKDSDDEGSIIDDNYNDDELNKIDEIDEENEDKKKSEKNVIKNANEKDDDDNKEKKQEKKPLKGILKKQNRQKEENGKKNEGENNEKKEEEINHLIKSVKIIENNEKKEEENTEKKEADIEKNEENIEKKEEEKTEEKEKEITEKKEEEKTEEKEKEITEKKEEEKTEEKKEEGNIEKKDGDNAEKKEEDKIYEKKEENIEKKEEEKNNKDENNKDLNKEEDKEEENDSLAANKIENENKDVFTGRSAQRKKSIVDENVIREIEPDDEIKNVIEEKMKILNNLKDENDSGEDSKDDSSKEVPIVTSKINMEEIPPIFQETLGQVEEKVKEYTETLKNHFYKESFEIFSMKLKELYDSKYKKYIMVNNEYHSNITEKEYLLENEENLSEEKKTEMKSIIDSLKEEQKDQIDKIVDEYNNNIILLINEFKQSSFKKNTSVQLLEEQLKLDIYTLINESFY